MFDAAAGAEQMDGVERDFVDRGELVELRAATGDLSERCRGRREVGAKRDGFAR